MRILQDYHAVVVVIFVVVVVVDDIVVIPMFIGFLLITVIISVDFFFVHYEFYVSRQESPKSTRLLSNVPHHFSTL